MTNRNNSVIFPSILLGIVIGFCVGFYKRSDGMTKIEGIPDGWELVRIGVPELGEWIIGNDGGLHVVTISGAYCYPIIRKVEKPKRYRPFANAEEFKPHRDRWCKIGVCESRVLNVNQQHVYFRDMSFTWEQAFIEITFEDGSPFGVEVTE